MNTAFVGPDPDHALVDGWRMLLEMKGRLDDRSEGPLATSYRLKSGDEHRFDRILISSDLTVDNGAYLYEEGVAAGSFLR